MSSHVHPSSLTDSGLLDLGLGRWTWRMRGFLIEPGDISVCLCVCPTLLSKRLRLWVLINMGVLSVSVRVPDVMRRWRRPSGRCFDSCPQSVGPCAFNLSISSKRGGAFRFPSFLPSFSARSTSLRFRRFWAENRTVRPVHSC